MSGMDGYRYPGPNEFEDTPADHLLFSGRNDEINAITQQIISSRLLVLYGSSGLGKSSLLKAGVYPKLRENNFCPVRVRITDKMDVLQLLAQSCAETARDADLDYTPGVGSTPWEFFKTAMFWRGETLLYPVLVFDQFEELFTAVAPSWKSDFANEIGPLASGNLPASVRLRLEQGEKGLTDLPPQVKLIFSLREEFYGSLEELSTDFPALFQDRFRLLPMDRSRAELAIRLPALKESEGAITFNTPPFTYSDETLKMMLGFLAGRHGTIEPFQLQLLCQHVERVIVPGKLRAGASSGIEITPNDLGGERVMSDLVRRFYTDSLTQLPLLQARRARELCDTGLLSSDGHRLMLEKNEILRNYKISEETLRHLIDRRILREEPRLESLFYEIGHDTIAASILKTRRWRLPRKYQVPAYVAGLLVVISTPIFIVMGLRVHYANISLQHEISQEKDATSSAKKAQGNAEGLASYLIGEDLMDAIKPIARIDVLEGVQKQIEDQGLLKVSLTGDVSSRAIQIEGLAYLNQGDLSYKQEKLIQASNEYEQARSAFQELVQRNPRNPEWLHNFADAETKLADVASDQYYLQRSLDLYQQALGHIQKSLAENDSGMNSKLRDKLLQDEANIYQSIGGIYYQQRRFADALDNMKRAVALATGRSEDMTQWAQVLEDGLLGEGIVYESQGKEKDAEKALQHALTTAKRSAEMNPFDPEAKRRLGVAENQLANFHIYRQDPEQVLAQYKSLNSIMQQAINWEPKNERWQRDLAYSYLLLQEGDQSAGKSDESERLLHNAISGFEKILKIDPSNASLISDLADSHRDWGLLLYGSDHPSAASSHYAESLKLLADLRKIDGTNKSLILTTANTLLLQAMALRNDRQPGRAVDACTQALQVAKTLEPVDPSDTEYLDLISALHQEMGDALQDQRDNKGANSEYQASLNDIDKAIQSAPSSPRYLNDRFLLRYEHMSAIEADLNRKLELDQKALADVAEAVDLDPATSYYAYNQAQAQMRLGDDFTKRKQMDTALQSYAGAEQSYRKAIEIAGKQDAQKDRQSLRELLENKIIPLREQMHDKRAVQRDFEEVIKIRTESANAEPREITYLGDLASSQTKLGDYLAPDDPATALSYYSDAEQTYHNAIRAADKTKADSYRTDSYRNDIHELVAKHIMPLRSANKGAIQPGEEAVREEKRLVAADPGNAANRVKLAKAYRDIGDDLLEQGQLTEAKEYYKHAEESQREAIKLQPSPEWWDELGNMFYNGFALLSEKQNDEEATVDYYRQAAEAEKQAVALAPQNAIYLSNMGYAYQAIGNTLSTQHDRASAEPEYKQSAQWFQKAILLDKNNPTFWYGLTLTSEGMAQVYEEAGDQTAAMREYNDALQAIMKAGNLDPKKQEYIDARVSINNKLGQLAPH